MRRRRILRNKHNRSTINARWFGLTIKALKQMNLSKLKSRKLWAAVIASVLTVLGDGIGLSPDVTRGIIAIAASYIIGQGISDHGAAGGSQGAQ